MKGYRSNFIKKRFYTYINKLPIGIVPKCLVGDNRKKKVKKSLQIDIKKLISFSSNQIEFGSAIFLEINEI